MEYAYKFRIYPTEAQKAQIAQTFRGCRFVYNTFLEERIELYKNEKKSLSYFSQSKEVKLLRQENPWLNELDSTALYAAAKDLDVAYQNFFRRVKRGEKPGFPLFKSRYDTNRSYRCRGSILLGENSIRLPKLGFVKCSISKKVEGRILSVTVSQPPSDRYYISICCTDVEIHPLPATGKTVEIVYGPGLEDGVFAIASDGTQYDMPHFLEQASEKLTRLQQKLSGQEKDSHRREKTRVKIARIYEHIANQRKDFLHQMTIRLVREYDTIYLPNVALKEKREGKGDDAKKIDDSAWGEFKRELIYKANWYGKEVIVRQKAVESNGEN